MTTKITLELPAEIHVHARTAWPAIAEVAEHEGYYWIAEQIRAQVPEMEPPEPVGDYLLREPSGQVSVPAPGHPGVLNRQDDGARVYWNTLWHYHGDDLRIYRPMPSPERIEELAQKYAEGAFFAHTDPDSDSDAWINYFRRAFADILGGEPQ